VEENRMVINHNISAINTNRQLGIVENSLNVSTAKLSSGYKINQAADNSSGLAISEKMRKQIRGLNQAELNIEDGVGYVQTADGALAEIEDMLQRMNELAIKSSNGTNSETDRSFIDNEVQQLKTEINRILDTTKFNDTYIWHQYPHVIGTVAGTVQKKAVTANLPSGSIRITNENYDVIAYGSYKVQANETDGVKLTWIGYNGKNYETDWVGWDVLENTRQGNTYSFKIADYFQTQDTELISQTTNNPVFNFTVSYSVLDETTREDFIKAVDGSTISSSPSTSVSVAYEDSNKDQKVTINSRSLEYSAAYASRANGSTSKYDFENDTDLSLEAYNSTTGTKYNLINDPCKNISSTNITATDIANARASTENWVFEFEMEGVGRVTATSYYINYYSKNEYEDDDEVYWWNWHEVTNRYNIVVDRYPVSHGYNISSGTLGSVMNALTGTKNDYDNDIDKKPGLLTSANNGSCDNGGYIYLSFNLTADNSYTYGNTSSKSVGSFSLRIPVSSSDTEADVIKRIMDSLNSSTTLDFNIATNSCSVSDGNSIHTVMKDVEILIDEVVYPDIQIPIHTGADAQNHMPITYEYLTLSSLGIINTNVRTEDAADSAVDEISEALTKVNTQRSIFGAYQNRLEKASKINANVSENTQSSESVIRDTDMETELVQYSNAQIVQQAAQSMLAQANQINQNVLDLLE
jgi:flagellin-like hook-associated protein FlgL